MPQNEFSQFVNVLQTELKIQAFNYTEDIAKRMAEEAVEILDEQAYAWKPLKEAYVDKKIRVGLDPRILIATGFYQRHITWGKRPNGTIWVGVEDVEHPDADMSLVRLARIHEFGLGNVPARPLWRPLLSKYVRESPQFGTKYRKAIEQAVRKKRKEFTRKKIKVKR